MSKINNKRIYCIIKMYIPCIFTCLLRQLSSASLQIQNLLLRNNDSHFLSEILDCIPCWNQCKSFLYWKFWKAFPMRNIGKHSLWEKIGNVPWSKQCKSFLCKKQWTAFLVGKQWKTFLVGNWKAFHIFGGSLKTLLVGS